MDRAAGRERARELPFLIWIETPSTSTFYAGCLNPAAAVHTVVRLRQVLND
jgi:hypothetical protein